MQKFKSKKVIVIAIILIILGVFFAVKNFSNAAVIKASLQTSESATTTVSNEKFLETITATGTVNLEDEVSIYAKEKALKIGEILVEEGDYINEGDVILSYDIKDRVEELEKTIDKLELSLKNEKLNLQNLLLPVSESDKISLQNNVIQAEKNLIDARSNLANYEFNLNQKKQAAEDAVLALEKAKLNYEQNTALFEVGAVTEINLNDSKNELEKAQNNYDTANNNVDQFIKTKTNLELSLKAAENTLEQSKIKLEESKNPLSTEAAKINHKKLLNSIANTEKELADNKKDLLELPYYAYSTMSGTVTSIPVKKGSRTDDNTVILKIADLKKLIVKASISEYDTPNIALGQKVEMSSDGIEGKTYYGTITKINHSAASTTTSLGSETVVPIEVTVENVDEILKPGYNLDLDIISYEKDAVLAVNSSSVAIDEQENEYVFLVDNGKVTKTKVKTGDKSKGKIEILEGISSGDEIITRAALSIVDGMTVEEALAAVIAYEKEQAQ